MKTIQNKTKLFFNILILLFISKSINAQSINLIGVELVNDSLKIIEWNNQTPSIYSSVGTSMFTVTMGTSTYNATNATYYVRGLVDSTSDVVMYDATTNVQQIVDISSFYSPSIESDMSTGMMYYYKGDASNQVFIYKYDPYTDSNYTLGLLPWSSGFSPGNFVYFPDATCFNSNEHIFHFTIADSFGKYLVSVPVTDSIFSFTITPFNSIFLPGNIGLEYDNVNNRIYTLFPVYDTVSAPPTMSIGLIDPSTATTSLLLPLPDLLGYEVFNRCFDQATNSLVFVAYDDTLYERKLYTYQIDSNLLNAFELPQPTNTYEVEVNNSAFARAKYGNVNSVENVISNDEEINLYPNPATDKINLSIDSKEVQILNINIYNSLGLKIQSHENFSLENTEIDISDFSSGMYIVEIITSNGKNSTKRFLKN
jgi:hypothetical protein